MSWCARRSVTTCRAKHRECAGAGPPGPRGGAAREAPAGSARFRAKGCLRERRSTGARVSPGKEQLMTQQWQSDLESWAGGWAAIRENETPQSVQAWNGSLQRDSVSAEELVLVCKPSEADAVREAVAAAGREVFSSRVLLFGAV